MGVNITKEYTGEITISIEPDDEYMYFELHGADCGLFFFRVNPITNGVQIITPTFNPDDSEWPLSEMRIPPKDTVIEILEPVSYTLPTKTMYETGLN